jgi:transmembrane sensor
LEDIALKMERWYGVSIVIRSESLKKELITGSFEKETIYQALKALQFTNKFTYTTEKEKIIISK